MTDETWGLTTLEFRAGRTDGAFLLGAGIVDWVFWVASTTIGTVIGNVLGDLGAWGLDFALVAVFIALLVSLANDRSFLLPWLVAGCVAVVADRLLPGTWYLLLGATAGSIAAILSSHE